MRFENQVAVVTGAGSGIGRAAAQRLAADGAKVVVGDISEEGGKDTVAQITAAGGVAAFVRVDTSDYSSVEQLVEAAVAEFGTIDIMVNNAGIGNEQLPLLDLPVEDYHRTVGVNQHGVYYGIRAAGAAMSKQGRGGVIINTASVYAYMAGKYQFPYNVSKAAVVMMTKAAALELAKFNIRVVAVGPGLIDTNIVAGWKDMPEVWGAIERGHMRRHAGKPEQVANVIAFLASEEASFVNGQVYMVDDGLTSFK